MQAKIKWYKEVLELDPNSKLFLPLARLLSNSEQIDNAIELLQHGLTRHPEYVEARIFYIELLYTDNRTLECQNQIENMTKLFTKYPAFWEAWGEYIIAKGQSKELALALTFIAACFKDSEVSFSNIFEIGLNEFMVKKSVFTTGNNNSVFETKNNSDKNNFNKLYDVVSQIKDSSISLKNAAQNNTKMEESDANSDFFSKIDTSNLDEIDRQLSLRTRSMADVLSEQGEIKKALDIYQELLQMADSIQENAELQKRIQELNEQLVQLEEDENSIVLEQLEDDENSIVLEQLEDDENSIVLEQLEDDENKVSKESKQPEGKDKLVSLLETLADRFEERAL